MIEETLSDTTKPNLPYMILIIGAIVPALRSREVCGTASCGNATDVYDESLSKKWKPCEDFFSYVCEGWLEKVYKKYDRAKSKVWVGTRSTGEDVVKEIFKNRAIRFMNRLNETSWTDILDSDIQAAQFFESCLHAHEKKYWELSIQTLRRFFHEIDLPFFDEVAEPGQVPLTALMRLALQYDFKLIIEINFRGFLVDVRKTKPYPTATDKPPTAPKVTAEKWRKILLNLSEDTSSDKTFQVEIAPLLADFQIHVPESTLIRLGRNYLAVKKSIKDHFLVKPSSTEIPFSLHSEALGSTYSDFFKEHLDNIPRMETFEKFKLVLDRFYFEPLVMVTRDPSLSQIFSDFLGIELLKTDFFQQLVHRTDCLNKSCDVISYLNTEEYCTDLVRVHSAYRRWSLG